MDNEKAFMRNENVGESNIYNQPTPQYQEINSNQQTRQPSNGSMNNFSQPQPSLNQPQAGPPNSYFQQQQQNDPNQHWGSLVSGQFYNPQGMNGPSGEVSGSTRLPPSAHGHEYQPQQQPQQPYVDSVPRSQDSDAVDRDGKKPHKKGSTAAAIGGGLLGFAATGRITGAAGGAMLGNLYSKHRHEKDR